MSSDVLKVKGVRSVASFGTDETIGRAVRQYSPMLLRLAATRLPSTADAEDAVQEAFIRLLDRRPVFQDAEHEKAWLIRVTLQRAADIRRRKTREAPLDTAIEVCSLDQESETELLSAVRALPEKYGAVIHLYYYEGYSVKEIAKLLGLPAATAGTRLARGRERLRRMLKEDE